jgi:hypothetical protein
VSLGKEMGHFLPWLIAIFGEHVDLLQCTLHRFLHFCKSDTDEPALVMNHRNEIMHIGKLANNIINRFAMHTCL